MSSDKVVRNRFVHWNGKTRHMFDLLEFIGDRVTIVYDGKRSKSGISRACGVEGKWSGRIIKLVSWTSHVAVIEFVGVE